MGWISALTEGITALAGAGISYAANSSAAGTASDAAIRAAEIELQRTREAIAAYKAAAERGIEAIEVGRERSIDQIQPIVDYSQEAPGYLRSVMLSSPDQLTPAQEQGLDDLNRNMDAYLATSGLRGAGRAGAAVRADATNRYLADAHTLNQNRADRSAEILEGRHSGARTNIAAIESDTGRQIASAETGIGLNTSNALLNSGNAEAQGIRDAGYYQAAGGLSSAASLGDAVGSIGAIIADEMKAARGGLPRKV